MANFYLNTVVNSLSEAYWTIINTDGKRWMFKVRDTIRSNVALTKEFTLIEIN